MNEQLKNILDLPTLQKMLDSLWRATGIPLGIIDVQGEVLVETGWQELCRQYHCKNPDVGQRCLLNWVSNRGTDGCALPGREAVEFVCESGLVNIVLPVLSEDHYLGLLFIGQPRR